MMPDPWLPDGKPLPLEIAQDAVRRGARVHLRLQSPGKYPKTACGRGLGQLWSGARREVTCPGCLEQVPSMSAPSMSAPSMSTGCRCWANTNALGHEGHCCFTVGGAWRTDDAVCHVPEESR